MSQEPIIDQKIIDDLIDLMGVDFIRELVDAFCEETPQLMTELRRALDGSDANTFRRLAHSIKSSSASLGALHFSSLARELESSGKQEQLTGLEPALDHLQVVYQQVEHALRQF